MNIRLLIVFIASFVCSLSMASCSKEKDNLDKLRQLTEQIEKEGLQYDEDQWESVLNKFGEVEEDCAKCEFSEEQLRQKGEYEGRVATALARYASQKLGEEMKNLGVKMQNSLIEFEGVAKGIADGMETFSHEMEGFSEQFKGIAEQFEGIMNGLIEDKK